MNIIFTAASHDGNKIKATEHLASLALLDDKDKVAGALNHWYESLVKDYGAWAGQYPLDDGGRLRGLQEKQKEWCDEVQVTFTPTILINGYRLPEPYRLEDLKHFMN